MFSFSSFTIDFKICLYTWHFNTLNCPDGENYLNGENLNEVQSSLLAKLVNWILFFVWKKCNSIVMLIEKRNDKPTNR